MRTFLLAAALIALSSASPAEEPEAPAPPSVSLFPGTENPQIKQCADGAAYIYKDHMILVKETPGAPGQEMDIYEPPPQDPCGPGRGAKYLTVPPGGADYFSGVSGGYLFIDQGTGPSYRTLSIFDMEKKTYPLRAVPYEDALIKDGIFTYYETLDEVEGTLAKVPCPRAAEWKRQGLNVAYEEQMSFDLRTGKLTPLRRYRCSPAQ
ncbi:MAG TPA: hypothetical protein VHC46_05505 [Thermodesulfobacteriota bacterium]|nr:hypothetical protein [Thermodesulfobacteriota bacterium]